MNRGGGWLFLMFQLPAAKASQRVSIWRKLQKYGALAWKNSAYVLPHTRGNLEKFHWLSAEIRKNRGDASIVEVVRIEGHKDKDIKAQFNNARARDYEELIRDFRLSFREAARQSQAQRRGALGRLNRRFTEIVAIDTFGCPKRKEAEDLLNELEARTAGNEQAGVGKNSLNRYRERIWMTRPRPGIDRVSSAWLIQHFIDPKARFVFSSDPQARPGAVRFDMFEGEFTHVGNHCTFETLMERFKLRDKRVRVIAQIVHDADLDDNKFGRAEGKGLDLIFEGWGRMKLSDHEILRRGFDTLDALYLRLET